MAGKRILIPLFIIHLVMALLPTGCLQRDKDVRLPETLAGAELTQKVEGPPAIAQITELHGTDIVIEKGYIGTYREDNVQVMLWISQSKTNNEATELFADMDRKIPANKVFSGRKEVIIEGQKVIFVSGMGMDNYYWLSGKINYWVSVAGADGEKVVAEVIKK